MLPLGRSYIVSCRPPHRSCSLYLQATINTIGAVCYTVGMSAQLGVGPLAGSHPRAVILVCKLVSALGWALAGWRRGCRPVPCSWD